MNFFNKNFSPLTTILTLFMLTICLSATMTKNSIYLWMLLEMNSLLFIFCFIHSSKNTTLVASFFITQALPGLIILWIMLKYSNFTETKLFSWIIFSTLLFKLGYFPFTWIPPIFMISFNWPLFFSYSTLIKFIPLLILKNIFIKDIHLNMFMWLTILTLIFSAAKGIKSNNLKAILSFSSINNTCWMNIMLIFNFKVFFILFFIYSIFMLMTTIFLSQTNIEEMPNFSVLNFYSFFWPMILFILSLLFSLGMIPPSSFFMYKMTSSTDLLMFKFQMFLGSLLISSAFSSLIYTSIMYKMFIYMKSSPKFLPSTLKPNNQLKPSKLLIFSMFIYYSSTLMFISYLFFM